MGPWTNLSKLKREEWSASGLGVSGAGLGQVGVICGGGGEIDKSDVGPSPVPTGARTSHVFVFHSRTKYKHDSLAAL